MPVGEVFKMSSWEISEWMAYFMTLHEKWVEHFKAEMELERQNEMTPDEKAAQFKLLLGGGK